MNINKSKKKKKALYRKKKARSRQYSAETITDTDYADDLALLANIPVQSKPSLHSLEQVAGGIDHYVFIGFKQEPTIFSLNGRPLNK